MAPTPMIIAANPAMVSIRTSRGASGLSPRLSVPSYRPVLPVSQAFSRRARHVACTKIAAPATANTRPIPIASWGVCKSKGSNIVLFSLISLFGVSIAYCFDSTRIHIKHGDGLSFRVGAECGELVSMKFATFRFPQEDTDQPVITFAAEINYTETADDGAEYATQPQQSAGVNEVGQL